MIFLSRNEKLPSERALASRGYLGYLWLGIKGTTVYSIYKKIASAVRKYALLSRIFKVVAAVISFVRASAALILIFGVLAVLTPALIAAGAIFLASSAVGRRRLDRYFGRARGEVYVFAFCGAGRVASGTAKELSERGCAVFITSSLRECGFSCAKRRADGAMNVHVSYFFRMKKILEKNGVKIYYIA